MTRSRSGRIRAHLLLYTERAGVVCRLHSAWAFGSSASLTVPWTVIEAGAGARPTAHARPQRRLRSDLGRAPPQLYDASSPRRESERRRQLRLRASIALRNGLLFANICRGLCSGWPWSADRRDRTASGPVWRTGIGPAHACLIPSGLVSRRKPASSRSVRRRARSTESGDHNRRGDRRGYYQAELHRLRGASSWQNRRRCRSGIVAPAGDRYRPQPAGEIP